MSKIKNQWDFPVGTDQWTAQLCEEGDDVVYKLLCNGVVREEKRLIYPSTKMSLSPQTVTTEANEGQLEVTIGAIGWRKTKCVATLSAQPLFASHDEAFKLPTFGLKALTKLEGMSGHTPGQEKTSEQIAIEQRAKERHPEIAVDISMGIFFFIVAKNFGLVTAAVSGAAITVVLFGVQRVIKMNLLGGFAVFGVCMALISAGLAMIFQDDTFVKLRGTIMGLIGVTCFSIDALRGGSYLGKRMAGYMEAVFPVEPQRAAMAMAAASFLLIIIDLPLVFLLTTDQWIFYNAFLDGFIAMPIVMFALWKARIKPEDAAVARASNDLDSEK